MKNPIVKRVLVWALIVLVLLGADLLTKFLAQIYLDPAGTSVPFLPGFIKFTFSRNYAIAFGFGKGNSAFMVFVVILTFVMIPGIAAVAFTLFKGNAPARITLAFVEAGAIGNLVDRLCLGYVRDFLDMSDFRPFAFLGSGFNFGVCNVADYFITLGAVALVFILLFIGPTAVFPLKKSWREEAKRREEQEESETK